MKHLLLIAILLSTVISLNAQNGNYVGLAVYNTQNAMPFGKFAGLFTDKFHPGIEALYGRNFSSTKKNNWFLELKCSYFFHRYVQHGIPLYLNFGYRYKITNKFFAETSVGAGYMHSVPATAKLKLNEDGEYENNKGVGRMQAMVNYSLGLAYTLNPSAIKPLTVFTSYQQRVQMPFVKSYVPLLPYNSFMVGIRKPFERNRKN